MNVLQRISDAIHSMGALDLVGVLVLALFLVLGFIHGFIGQAARLVAIVLGFFVARAGAPHLAPIVGDVVPSLGEGMRTGIAYGSLFVGVLLLVAVVGLLVRKAVETLHLGFFDRLGGAALGLVTGAVLHFAILVCVILFAKEDRLALLQKDSRSLRAAVRVAQMVSPALPPEARTRIEAARARVPEPAEESPASAPADKER